MLLSFAHLYRKDENMKTSNTNLLATLEIDIRMFGAHSINESGFSTFDSSDAINSAIQYASNNNYGSVNLTAGKFYAKNIILKSNITYFSNANAELIASPSTIKGNSILSGQNLTNIIIKNIILNGNKTVVAGSSASGSELISLSTCTNIIIEYCYLHNNNYLAILLSNGCSFITVNNNHIYDTDCGLITLGSASNNILIDGNEIDGGGNEYSEPISIFHNSGIAYNIIVTNNKLHDKSLGSGVYFASSGVQNSVVKGNICYNLAWGVSVINISSYVTISDNVIYTCGGGISITASDITISNNIIHDSILTSMRLTTAIRCNVSGNSIINPSKSGQEAGIRLTGCIDCVLDNNIIQDIRDTIITYANIQFSGIGNLNNVIQNHNKFGTTLEGDIVISQGTAAGTILRSNTSDIIDQGINTKSYNNISKSQPNGGWTSASKNQIIVDANSDLIYASNTGIFNNIAGTSQFIGRKIMILFKVLSITITSGSNIKLVSTFSPTVLGSSLILIYDGVFWNEIARCALN